MGKGIATNARMGQVRFRYTNGEGDGHECTNGMGKIQVYEWGMEWPRMHEWDR